MSRFRCVLCAPMPAGHEFEADGPACPRCGNASASSVFELCDVHLMVPDPRGPIQGKTGRWRIACDARREHMALHPHDDFQASDDARAVTCRSCRGTPHCRELARHLEAIERATRGGIQISADGGCCG